MKINKNKVNMFHKTNRVTKSNLTNKEKHIEIMDKMAIKLRGIKIKNRLMISFAVVLITQIIVIAFFSIYFSGGLIKSKVSDFSSQEMSLISKNIQSSLDNYKSDILSITMGKEFQDSFSNYSTLDELSKATFVNTLKESTIKKYIMDENVSSVVLVDIAGKFIGGKGYNSVFADKILNLKDNKDGTIYLSIVNISEDTTKPFYGINLFREIKSTTSGSTIGYIWVNLKEDILYSIYKDNIKGNDTSLMILDSKGTVISSKNKEDINKVYSNKTLIEKVLNSTKSTTLNIDNKGYLVSSSIIDGYGWKLVNTVATSYLNKEASIIKYSIIGIAIIEFLLAILVAYMISTSISNPLDTIMHSIQMAKEGKIKAGKNDLNDDEVGEVSRNFNEMMDNLSSLIGSTKDSSSKISNSIQSIVEVSEQSYAASEEIAATMNEVATGAGSQAEGMSTTISNLNKLSDAIDQVEISLKDTLQVIYNTKGMGEDTKTAITFLKEKSRDTKGVSVKISDNISELSTYMKEIGSITKLIVGISEQTNLLALNASIEAARVGDVGRGFTIVAEQVKKLAIQSKDASTKIDKIMGELTKKIVFITQSASKTQSIIAKQDEAIEETDSTALSIITSMEGVGENITELIGFIKEIHVLKGETVSSIEGINAVSEETAAITEEVTATTQEQILDMENLSGAATSLNEMIKKLNTTMSMFEV